MIPLSRIGEWTAACKEAFGLLVFPMSCAVCDRDGLNSAFCGDCRRELIEAADICCPRCASTVGPWARFDSGCSECRGRSLGFDAAIALGAYQGPIRQMCLWIKKESNAWLARWLVDLLVEARSEELNALGATCIVPVPLHWSRHWERGYNQAEALADRLARCLRLPIRRPLRRVRATHRLASMSRQERAKTLRGAFTTRRRLCLEGQTVLLMDDILTTGATCGEAARVLKRAGAARVVAVVIGRAEGRT